MILETAIQLQNLLADRARNWWIECHVLLRSLPTADKPLQPAYARPPKRVGYSQAEGQTSAARIPGT
jgi:hypothetical protein